MRDDGSGTDDARPLRLKPKCPMCRAPAETATRPFCSQRCADLDLARWLGGRYAIAGREDAEEDETVSADSLARRLPPDDPDED